MNPALQSPTKMVIFSYEKPDFSDAEPVSYTVRVNPDKYSQTYRITYDSKGAPGSPNAALKFNKAPPADLKFELLFDATGAIENSPTDLTAEIKKFRSVVYDYDGEGHQPKYLQISWGKLAFGARLTSMTVNYTLFTSGGNPLRARADVSFSNYQDPASIEKEADKKSPDLTRHIAVKAGDTLPLLSYRVYGDTKHTIDLARVNGLVNFRNLRTGQTLVFPPLA